MYPVRRGKSPSAAAKELSSLAATRQSRWLANVLSWTGAMIGVLGVVALVVGFRRSLSLPTVPRPNVGPGFSESATAAFGGAIIGGCLSLAAIAFVALALLHSRNRSRTLCFASPVVAFLILLLSAKYWNQ